MVRRPIRRFFSKALKLAHACIKDSKGICDTETTAQPGDFLSVHYTGRFNDENGEIFDTSKTRGQLYKFQLGAGRVSLQSV